MLQRTSTVGTTSLVAARVDRPDDELLDPTVFVIDVDQLPDADRPLLDELVELCRPQAGAAAIIIGDHPGIDDTIRLDADGHLDWRGEQLDAVQVSREAAAQVAVMFDHAAHGPILETAPTDDAADDASIDGTVRWSDDTDTDQTTATSPPGGLTVRIFGDETHGMPDLNELGRLLVVLVASRRSPVRTADIRDVYRNRYLRRSKSTVEDALTAVVKAGYLTRPAPGQYVLAPDVWYDLDALQTANERIYNAHTIREQPLRNDTEAAAVGDLLRILKELVGPAYSGPGFDRMGATAGLTEGSRQTSSELAQLHLHESLHLIQRWAREQDDPEITGEVLRTIAYVLTSCGLDEVAPVLIGVVDLSCLVATGWYAWLRNLLVAYDAPNELLSKLDDRLSAGQ